MKRVLISGGSRGIGRELVKKIAKKGYIVSFIYNNSKNEAIALEKETGAKAFSADVSNYASLEKAVASIIDYMGGVDILINNAGIAKISLLTDMAEEEINKIVSTNLLGTIYLSKLVAPYMVKNHFGRIINIGSMWGKAGASCESVYSASKAGVEGFTKALAKELGLSGIMVNCIEPGFILTDMNKSIDEETIKEIAGESAVGRVGKPNEVAEFICSIATEKSGFLTGQIIGFDGGMVI